MPSLRNDTLPLSYFIRRQRTIQLYRQLLRAVRNVEPSTQVSIKREIISEFKRNAKMKDDLTIKMLISDAGRSLHQLKGLSVKGVQAFDFHFFTMC